MIRAESPKDDLELNMAPMIDMVFLLIIFFLTTTSFTEKEREQDVLLPANRMPGSLSRSADHRLIVNVLRDGSISVLGAPIGVEALSGLVHDRRERAAQPLKVQVRADRRAIYGDVARVLEAIERGGVERPYIITQQVELGE